MRHSLKRKPTAPETIQLECKGCGHLGRVIKRWYDQGHPGPCPECGAHDYGDGPGYDIESLFPET